MRTRPCVRLALSAAILAVLVGCAPRSMTLYVQGSVQNSSETFSGSATGYSNGAGFLDVVTNTGVSCSGNFVYVTARRGQGVFRCSDGRSGPFSFVSSGTSGLGQGTLGEQVFTFTFG